MARVVMYTEHLEALDCAELLSKLGDDVLNDAHPPVLTGHLAGSGKIVDRGAHQVTVEWSAEHPDEPGSEGHYSYWVEVGTSDTPASRFIEKALYRYRAP